MKNSLKVILLSILFLIAIMTFFLIDVSQNFLGKSELSKNIMSKEIFLDKTNESGVSYFGKSFSSSWGDFNNDSFPDLFVGNHGNGGGGPNLFLNNGNGTFTDILKQMNLEEVWNSDLHTATWVDFDNDDDQDLFIIAGGQKGLGEDSNKLLISENGSFKEVAKDFGLDYPQGRGRAPLWFDWDNDGLLDVILGNAPRPDKKSPSAFFHQTSNGFKKQHEFQDLGTISSIQLSNHFFDGHMNIFFLTPSPEAIYEISESQFNKVFEDLIFFTF